jgi:hypothetical protein
MIERARLLAISLVLSHRGVRKGVMVREVETSVRIDATPERVWEVLVDFPSYPEWNPFVTSVTGDPAVGTKLRVTLRPPGGRGMTFRPKVLVAEPGHELRWIGHLLIPGLFDGEHRFVIEPTGLDSCTLTQAERFSGVLVALFGQGLKKTEAGFDSMNQALKARCEHDRLPHAVGDA